MAVATLRELWMGYCEAVAGIRERFGLANALEYVVGKKLMTFSQMAETDERRDRERRSWVKAMVLRMGS